MKKKRKRKERKKKGRKDRWKDRLTYFTIRNHNTTMKHHNSIGKGNTTKTSKRHMFYKWMTTRLSADFPKAKM